VAGRLRGALAPLALACGALTACNGYGQGSEGPSPCAGPIGGHSTPLANLGPDLDLQVLCGGASRGAIASIDVPGSGSATWTASLAGSPQLTLEQSSFVTCSDDVTVAFVDLQVPPEAKPGDTYDAVATIESNQRAFPTGTVKVHGEVVAPKVTAPSSLDFGEVPASVPTVLPLRVVNKSPAPVVISPEATYASPFGLTLHSRSTDGNTTIWDVKVFQTPPGDYTETVTFTGEPAGKLVDFPPGCVWTQTITLHAHVFADTDGGPDASRDGGTGDDAPSSLTI